MGKPHLQQLRRAVVQAIAEGQTRKEVAETYNISLSSVARFLRRWRQSGDVRPEKVGGHKAYALEGHERQIKAWIAERPEITLAELRARLERQNIVVGKSSIARFLNYLDGGSAEAPKIGHARQRTLNQSSSGSRTKPARLAGAANDARGHPTRFKRGQPRPPGSGRSAGTPNKSTTILSGALFLAAEETGDHDALVDYLRTAAANHPKVFASLLGKLQKR
jgi:transposase